MIDTKTKNDGCEKTLVILIDSFKKVSEAICQIDDLAENNFEVKVLNPFDSKKNDNEGQKDFLCRQIKRCLDQEYDNHILISNKEYLKFDRDNGETSFIYRDDPLTIDSLLKVDGNGEYPLDKKFRNKLSRVLIYSYNRWHPQKFHQDAKKLVEILKYKKEAYPAILKDKKGRSHVVIPETGVVFRLYPYENLSEISKDKLKNEKKFSIGSSDIVEQYGRFIASIVEEFIKSEINGSQSTLSHYLHLNSLRYNKFMAMVNDQYFQEKDGFKLSTVSVIAQEIKTYLLDVPYRSYYGPMNEYITAEGKALDTIFLGSKDGYKQGLNYIYYNYGIDPKNTNIYLNEIFKYEKSTDGETRKIYDGEGEGWHNTTEEEKELSIEWLSILDASIFYNDNGLENGQWRDDFVNRIIFNFDKSIDSNYRIEIFWFYHDIQMEEYSLHAAINYSFYRVHNKDSDGIHEKAREYYDLRRPIISAKAKEVLFPYYHSEMMKYALQSAVSQVTARNYAHHIGSHVKNRTTLPKINERIRELYPEINI